MKNIIIESAPEVTVDSTKLNIANQFLQALKEKDWELLRSIITDDITWSLPGDAIISGKITGAEAVINRSKVMVGFGVSLQLNRSLIALNGVALSLHNKASRNGLELDVLFTTICTLRGDKIAAINTCLSDVKGMNAFFTLENADLNDANIIASSTGEMVVYEESEKSLLATTFVGALKNNDWELMKSIMSPALTWTLPGTSLLSGLADGVGAVIKRAQSLKQFGVMFDLRHIVYGMNGFALLLHNTAKRGDLILDEFVAIVFDIAEGKVQRMTTYLSDVPNIEEFFIPGII